MKRGATMQLIPWETCSTETKNGVIADIGDIRLILKRNSNNWTLSMGIRVYTTDRSHSMVRPPSTVLQIPLPCELEEAKEITQKYFTKFLASVINTLIDV